MKDYFIYIMSSKARGALYVGMTNDLVRRAYEHRNGRVEGHTKRYNIRNLVYYEHTNDVHAAISREKRIKAMRRAEKLALVDSMNPTWRDLYDELR